MFLSVEGQDRKYFKTKNYAALVQAAFCNGNKMSERAT
jgi:hypothetical protein